jgi:hypothetical protein
MRVTVVTNARGEVIASVDGSVSAPRKRRGITATIVPQDGQKFHEIEVPQSYAKLEPLALLKALADRVKGST